MTISWGAMTWVNQPRRWLRDGPDLTVHTEPHTDFWRTTAVGYDRDSGHAFLAREQGDLAAEATVRVGFASDYDEAGLMIRLSDRLWTKAVVQLRDGVVTAAVVVTRDASDFSGVPLDLPADGRVRVRLEREGNAVRALFGPEEGPFRLARLSPFPAATPVGIGPTCSSPHGGAPVVEFTGCSIVTGRPSWAWLA